jgi:hypothetical protein
MSYDDVNNKNRLLTVGNRRYDIDMSDTRTTDPRALFDALKPVGISQKRIHKGLLAGLNDGDYTFAVALNIATKCGIKDYRDA